MTAASQSRISLMVIALLSIFVVFVIQKEASNLQNDISTTNTSVSIKPSKDDSEEQLRKQERLDLMEYNLVRPLTEFTKAIDHWELYKNQAFHFSFEYPNTYIKVENSYNQENGHVLTLMAFNGNATNLSGDPNPGFFDQVTVSYWKNINNEYFKYLRGDSWQGERRYKNFEDFLSDSRNTLIEVTGNISIDGQKAYVLSMPGDGAYEAVMFEYKGGYYKIGFPGIGINSLDKSIKDRFLKSFQLF